MQSEKKSADVEPKGSNTFAGISIEQLAAMRPADTDALPFGVVGLDPEGIVEIYNATESRLAGIPPAIVLGWHYFAETAQCMNNFMVAQRLDDEAEIDDIIDYVLTLRMRPTPVRVRMLKSASIARRYILIER